MSGNNVALPPNSLFGGAFYMLVTRLGIKSLGLISSVFLARLLTPADFGIVAIAMAVYAFIELFGAFGFGTALIQRKNKNADEYNTAWTFKCIFGVVSAICIVTLATPAASYFADERLAPVLNCIALISILSGLSNIGIIDFQKDLQFQKELKLLLIPKLISFIFTLCAAFYLRNYWALVFGMIFNQTLNLIFSYTMHKYRPQFTLIAFSALFNFSKWIFLNNVVTFINSKISEIIIGKRLSMTDAGLFSLANEFASIPTTEIAAPINKASYPVYARLQDSPTALKAAYLDTLFLTACLTLPASVGIYAIAPIFVEVVLGKQWLTAVSVMQLIAISGIFASITNNIGYLYLAKGQPRANFYIGLARSLLYVPMLLVFLPLYGIEGAGYATLLSTALLLFSTQIAASITIKISFSSLIQQIYRPMFAVSGMYVAILMLPQFTEKSLQLILSITTGAITYLVILIFISALLKPKNDLVIEAIRNIKNKLQKKPNN